MNDGALAGARALLQRRRPVRYLVAGAFNTLVSYGGYAIGLAAGLGVPQASAVGVLCGVAVGYLTQGRFVFRQAAPGSLVRFLLAWASMYGLHVAIVTALQMLGVNPFAGGIVALAVITSLSYFVLRDLVFRGSVAAAQPDQRSQR